MNINDFSRFLKLSALWIGREYSQSAKNYNLKNLKFRNYMTVYNVQLDYIYLTTTVTSFVSIHIARIRNR